jgi:hypothetical protein
MLLVLCAVATAVTAPPVVLLLALLEWRAPEVLLAVVGSDAGGVDVPSAEWDEVGARARATWTMAPVTEPIVRRSPVVGDQVELHRVVLAAPVRAAVRPR